MPIKQEDLENLIRQKFPQAKIEITDLAGDNDHYSLAIADKNFAGKTRVEQHKMVNEALKEILGTTLHALQVKTSTIV